MSVVTNAVEDVGDFLGDTVDFVGDTLDDAWDVVVDAADWTLETIESTVQGALDNPIGTIAKVAAIATQQYHLLPYISAADTAAQGGDVKDIAKSAAIAYVANEIATNVAGVEAGATGGISVDDAGIALLPSDVAYNAAVSAGGGIAGATGSQLVGNISGGAAGSAFNTAVRGGDLDQILMSSISGGAGAGIATSLSELSGKYNIPKAAIPVFGAAGVGGVNALLKGDSIADGVLRGAAVGGINSAVGIAGSKVQSLYNSAKEYKTEYEQNIAKNKEAVDKANEYAETTYNPLLNETRTTYDNLLELSEDYESKKSILDETTKDYDYLQVKANEYYGKLNPLQTSAQKFYDKAAVLKDEYDGFKEKYDSQLEYYNTAKDQYNNYAAYKASTSNPLTKAQLKENATNAADYLERYATNANNRAARYEDEIEKFNSVKVEIDKYAPEYNNYVNRLNEITTASQPLINELNALSVTIGDTSSRYNTLVSEFENSKSTYQNIINEANKYKTEAETASDNYNKSYVDFVDASIEFNQELMDYTKDVTERYVENTGEIPDTDTIQQLIDSNKTVDEIESELKNSDAGQRWSDIRGQSEDTSKIVGSGLYNYQDTSMDYITKAEQAFANRNSDLGMYYQYKALENEINNNPNSIYARDEEGNIFDQTTGITYLTPDTYQIEPEEWKAYQASLNAATTLPDVVVYANPIERELEEDALVQSNQNTPGDPRDRLKIVKDSDIDLGDGTTQVTFEDGSTGIVDSQTGKIVRGDIEFTKSEDFKPLYSDNAYARAMGDFGNPATWLDTWYQKDSKGLDKETGFAASQGLTVTPDNTYKDPAGNEYKKVTINNENYLQDINNPTGLYKIDGGPTGTPTGNTSGTGTVTTGAGAGTGTGTVNTTAGDGSGTSTTTGTGSGMGTGTGGGNLSGALDAADYIAKNDYNKDGIVNAADTLEATQDSIDATALLTGLYKQGQRQQVVQKAVQGMRRPIDGEPAKVIQGEQATLGSVDTFSPEAPAAAATPTQPTGDLYFDESQVVNDSQFGTPQQTAGQQQLGQNLFFDESQIRQAAEGGQIEHNPQFFSEGGLGTLDNRYVRGEGDGTSDSVPAMLASGEFVIPADVVSGLGNGDNDAGAAVLDEFMKAIRAHKRAADPSELPEDSKGPLAYLQEAMKKVRA